MTSSNTPNRLVSFLICIGAYTVALVVAIVVLRMLPDLHLIWRLAAADVAATVVVFIFSVIFRNSSLYDPYWSVAPIFIVLFWWLQPEAESMNFIRMALVSFFVTTWGIRLTLNWATGWTGLDHEDWRYVDLREKTGKAYFAVNFSGIHLFPTVMVFVGCLPLYASMHLGNSDIGLLDIVSFIVMGAAVLIETVSDLQLRKYVRSGPAKGDFLKSGLWAYSRHPNYLGEVMFWWGLFLSGIAAVPALWWTGAGALAILLMFYFISIPMIDKRMVGKRPGYADHMKEVPRLFPWF